MYYAVGYRGWVEVRRALAPPKQKRSVLKLKPTYQPRIETHPETGRMQVVNKLTPKEVTFRTVVGGTVLYTIKRDVVSRLIGFAPITGNCHKLNKAQFDAIDAYASK